ncbi:MAG: rRNA maturation RNase YbeY [Fimbriimonadaceae bacterium]|nr:rRNA maturation RNase YbeY [Chitinophagales bacterium]
MPRVNFHILYPNFKLKNRKKIILWLEHTINAHGYFPGKLNFIFCSDDYLFNLNSKHLHHKTFTDIITFNYNSGHLINGDVFISIERVDENAQKFNETFDTELNRVMIHGVLHLLGFDDKNASASKKMRVLENKSLKQLQNILFHMKPQS